VIGAFLLAAAVTGSATAGPAPLVRYSFDEPVDTGPDTFAIFQHAKGTVRLASNPVLSGFHSLEIKDVAGDGTFPELQGYFQERRRGRLYAHFAFLTTDTSQDLNIALAGRAHFTIRKDGIAFWLAVKKGQLVHYPATRVVGRERLAAVGRCVPTVLGPAEPFLWYVVDVAYDVDAGTYDLTIRQEGRGEPLVRLLRQRNAAAQPGSAVDKFSFIGDLEDAFAATYYVDDVVIGTDERIVQLPFVAPGRRRLFVDRFADLERQSREGVCLPLLEPADLGLTDGDVDALRGANLLGALSALSEERPADVPDSAPLGAETRRRLQAASVWASGCAALAETPSRALEAFDRAAALAPEATIFTPSSVLALAALRRWPEAEARLRAASWAWRQDPRFGILLARLGQARGGLEEAEAWLRGPAEAIAASGAGTPMVAETYYFVLLAKGDLALAQDFAERAARRLEESGPPSAEWLERAGDAALRQRRLAEAKQLYERSRRASTSPVWILLKLSDVAWIEEDLAQERAYRERVYGALREGP
jgi:tetratricopeptide (TPR) repeat protein